MLVALALLAGCDHHAAKPSRRITAGDRLEAAALANGLVTDPARVDPVGLFARGDDRLCLVPARSRGVGYGIGVLVRYDEVQGCVARGTAARSGDRLDIDLGKSGECRFSAQFDGDRIVFPADLPADCDSQCSGRASLGALTVDRFSDGAAEAETQRDSTGHPLCN